MRHVPAGLLLLALGTSQAAPPVVISAVPDVVAVTLYRDPYRDQDEEMDREDPSSIALIAETRTVTLPAGQAVVRFEGVASGIVPQSAILFGASPRERNRDAALLSKRGLVDAFTGQGVILRRTDPATGKTVEERAKVRSAANRLVVETPRGIEAVYCSGLNQTLVFPEAPVTLSAKPVLSMTTKDQPGGTVTITLAYLATGFDWDATYVGTLAPDGKSLALLGWLTMASGDDTSFPDATTSAVAGAINRSDETRDDAGEEARADAESLDMSFGCWPEGTTSYQVVEAPMAMSFKVNLAFEEVVVTTRKVEERMRSIPIAVTAMAESLGDLKLYRIPIPVTVAAHAQKQVAFLLKERVSGELVYRSWVFDDEPEAPEMLFRFRNRKQDGLGDPLPAGKVVLYQDSSLGRMLVGESSVGDKTVDEEVELVIGEATEVTIETEETELAAGGHDNLVTIRNANPFPVRYEIDFPTGGYHTYSRLPRKLVSKPGKRVWTTVVPANGSVRLTYRSRESEEE